MGIATLGLSAVNTNRTGKSLSTATGLAFIGNVANKALRSLAAGLLFVGVIARSGTFSRSLSGVLSLIGSVPKSTARNLLSALSFGIVSPYIVSRWAFTDGSGTTVLDDGPNGNNLTTSGGPTWGSGFLTFDGSSQTARRTSAVGVNGLTNFSIAASVKLANAADTNRYVASNRVPSANSDRVSLIYGFTANKYELYSDPGQFSGAAPRTALATSVSDTNWHHICFTYDGTDVRGYLDGVLDVTATKAFSLATVGVIDQNIATADGTSGWFNGSLRQIGVYTRALTQAEVTVLAAGGDVFPNVPPTVYRLTLRGISAVLSFVGSRTTLAGRNLAGALTFIGASSKSAVRALAGVLTFVGNLLGGHLFVRALAAALSFVGNTANRTGKSTAGILSFAGALPTRVVTRTVTATMSFIGSAVKSGSRSLSGTLSLVGARVGRTGKSLTATLSSSGSVVRFVSRAFNGILTFSGFFSDSINHFMSLVASLSFSGARKAAISRAIPGTLSFIGAATRSFSRSMAGVLTFVGSRTDQFGRMFSATLSFVGATTRGVTRAFFGSFTPTGSFVHLPVKAFSATLSFAGASSRRVARGLTAVLSFVGFLLSGGNRYFQVVAGALSFSGSQMRMTGKAITATLSFVGTTTRSMTKGMSSVLSFSGTFSRSLARALVGATLSFSGAITRVRAKLLTAILSFRAGAAFDSGFGYGFETMSGLIKLPVRSLSATLALSGVLAKGAKRLLTVATLSLNGLLNRGGVRNLSGVLSFSGNASKGTLKALSAALSLAGTFATQVFKFLQVHAAAIPNILNLIHFDFRSIGMTHNAAPADIIKDAPVTIAEKQNRIDIIVKGP